MVKVINSFPGYEFKNGKNIYRNTEIGFGGYIISNPGIYTNVALLDVASLHPNSIRAMNCFGDYTKNFTDIIDARVAIKHGDLESARQMMDGRLAPYLDDESKAKDLAQALKIAINSVYGLTAAGFDNPFRDIRNKNNIVALRGALFMRTLQDEVESRGFKIVAIKTDSIKIADASKEIIDFCMNFAKKYSYEFEHEATYDRMCQINDADYVARYKDPEWCKATYGYIPGDNAKHAGEWTATGAQFQVPYVFKKLFSRESIEFEDLCETKQVSTSLYLDMNEELPDVSEFEKIKTIRDTYTQKGADALPKKDLNSYNSSINISDEELENRISEGHSYCFIGKVGQFCPIKEGRGGGVLCRESKDKYGNTKYAAPSGSKGYRWLESEMVKQLGKEDDIDRSFYDKLVDDAAEAIAQYGDLEWFISDDSEEPETPPCLETPPWIMECGAETCEGCKHFVNDENGMKCTANYDISDLITFNKNN